MCLLWSDMGSGQEGGGYYCGEYKRTFGVSIVLIAYSVNKIKTPPGGQSVPPQTYSPPPSHAWMESTVLLH